MQELALAQALHDVYWHCVVLPLPSGVVVALHDAAVAYGDVTTVWQFTAGPGHVVLPEPCATGVQLDAPDQLE